MSEKLVDRDVQQTATRAAGIGAEGTSPRKIRALEGLRDGKSFSRAAHDAGVSRQTLYAWRRSDPRFAAALQKWEADMLESRPSWLIETTDVAMTVIQRHIEAGDPRLAMEFLRNNRMT